MPEPNKPSARIIEAIVIAVISGTIAAGATSMFTAQATAMQVAGLSQDFAEFRGEIRGELKDLKSVIYRPSWDRENAPSQALRPIAESRKGARDNDDSQR